MIPNVDPIPSITTTGSGPLMSRPWWETREFVALMIVIAALPLLWPPIPPLVDLLGHMGRYRVELDGARSPELQRYFSFHWLLAGNLGVDLLVWPLGKLMGLEPAVKLIVILIPMMTVAGMLWVAREVHGRLPPTVAFALPFAFGQHFLFGFVNYALSGALALLAFGLWLRLGRIGKTWLRAALFVPISVVVWTSHVFGWGLLGLLAFSAESVRQHDRGRGWLRSGPRAAWHCLSLTLPTVLMLAWREKSGGTSMGWFEPRFKWMWLQGALRDRWMVWDLSCLALIAAVFLLAVVHPRLTLSRMLGFTTIVLSIAFVLLPRIIFGSAYADMRLVPYLFAVAMLAIRFKSETRIQLARPLAFLALAFVIARTVSVSASLFIASQDHQAKFAALDHIPVGAPVLNLVGIPCERWPWPLPRNDHIGSMVVTRRLGFANNIWVNPGAALLRVHYAPAGMYSHDPSELVRPNACRSRVQSVDVALGRFNRQAFEYVWLVDVPPYDRKLLSDAALVFRGPGTELYRLRPAAAPPPG